MSGLICMGHIITNDCDDFEDIKAKKSSLIGHINKILYTFSNVNCLTKAKLVKSYCTSDISVLKINLVSVSIQFQIGNFYFSFSFSFEIISVTTSVSVLNYFQF